MSRPRYILVGGFVGAGKTTAIGALARYLAKHGRRVALVANGHGAELIDTAEFRLEGLPTEEVAGGDLASRFPAFLAAATKLEATATPDDILVETVGTSLDLKTTLARPLRQLEGKNVAPLSVLLDPVRAEQVLGLETGKPLSAELLYVYRQQLQEADILVISQADRLDETRLERLRGKLAAEFPKGQVVALAPPQDRGLDAWLALLDADAPERSSPEIDAAACAEGAAAVGCLNAVVEFTLSREAPAPALLESMGLQLGQALQGVEVLHLHAALRGDDAQLGTIHLVGNGMPQVTRSFHAELAYGELMINLRAVTHPEQLHTAVRTAIVGLAGEFPGMITEFAHLHYFRPAPPEPVHRISTLPA